MTQHTGGMIAWVPRGRDADQLAVTGDGAEPVEELHVTIAYLGDDVTSLTPEQRRKIGEAVWVAASDLAPQRVRIGGHAVFNPNGENDGEPCAVYLVNGNSKLIELHNEFAETTDQEQFTPYVAHITAGYGTPIDRLTFTGEIVLDRLRLALGNDVTDFPLTGKSEGKESTVDDMETKREFSQAKRDKLAKTEKATNEGSYPIESIKDLQNAISAYGRANEEDRPKIRAHIVRNAKRLKATNMLPKNWSETPAKEKKVTWRDAPDPLTAGVLMGLSGLSEDEAIETKAGPPGATFPSPDPGAAKLRQYWTKGPGAAKIKWGTDGDFDRCVRQMRKYVGKRAEGLCNIYHRSALGAPPGKGHKDISEGVEEKGITLWMPDPESKAGYRAVSTAWMHVTDPDLARELAQPEVKTAATEAPADESASTESEPVESSLDKFEAMADQITTEDVYEEALASDFDWEMDGSGNLTPDADDPDSPTAQTQPGELSEPAEQTDAVEDVATEQTDAVEEPESSVEESGEQSPEQPVLELDEEWGALGTPADESDEEPETEDDDAQRAAGPLF